MPATKYFPSPPGDQAGTRFDYFFFPACPRHPDAAGADPPIIDFIIPLSGCCQNFKSSIVRSWLRQHSSASRSVWPVKDKTVSVLKAGAGYACFPAQIFWRQDADWGFNDDMKTRRKIWEQRNKRKIGPGGGKTNWNRITPARGPRPIVCYAAAAFHPKFLALDPKAAWNFRVRDLHSR